MTQVETSGRAIFCRGRLPYASPAGMVAAQELDVLDGRQADLPGWEQAGFELVEHRSTVADWLDGDDVAAHHYAEVEEIAKRLTGAPAALVSSHITRSPADERRHQQLGPIQFVHSDFAASHESLIRSSYQQPLEMGQAALARNGLTPADVKGAARLVILQLWRNVGPPKMDYPLAFCDARTVLPEDSRPLHVENYAGSGYNFDALAVFPPAPPRRHDWYVFPELTAEEAVAFRTYDTELVRAGATFFTPHAAIADPEVRPGRPARQSVELRATCVWA